MEKFEKIQKKKSAVKKFLLDRPDVIFACLSIYRLLTLSVIISLLYSAKRHCGCEVIHEKRQKNTKK